MKKKVNINDLPDFDITQYLDDEQAIADYLPIVYGVGRNFYENLLR